MNLLYVLFFINTVYCFHSKKFSIIKNEAPYRGAYSNLHRYKIISLRTNIAHLLKSTNTTSIERVQSQNSKLQDEVSIPPKQNPEPEPEPFFGIPGMFVGIPLNILTYIYTSHHYHENIMTPKLIILQLLIGLYTYGNDKYNDAIEYEKSQNKTQISIDPEKEKMYKYIIKNNNIFPSIYNNVYYIILLLLFENNGISFDSIFFFVLYNLTAFITNTKYTFFSYYLGIKPNEILAEIYFLLLLIYFQRGEFRIPFLLLLDVTNKYIDIKRNNKIIKPFFVSFMWMCAILILPSVLHDQNYNILESPKDYLSPFFLIFGLTNYVDIKDMEEDRINGIKTIPLKYGKEKTLYLCYASLITSFILYQ